MACVASVFSNIFVSASLIFFPFIRGTPFADGLCVRAFSI